MTKGQPLNLGALAQEEADETKQAEANRQDIVKLGRFFEATIEDYISSHGDIPGEVVLGACRYISELYQERMVGYMRHSSKMWGQLKGKLDQDGVKVHEPFENDGLDSQVFAKGPNPA